MHLEQLRLTAFGPFTGCTVDLKPGLNLLYGPNEAGKSSALRAIHALLFGVPSRTTDNFLHSYPQLRVGGVLVRADNERLEFVRRKGNKATLRDHNDDKPLDDSALDPFLGAVDEEFFRSVFGIDHERMRVGGEEVLRGEGRIGELLFAAGGVSHLREIQQRLESDATALFKPRAQQPRINHAVSKLDQLRSEIRQSQVSADEWARHEAEKTRQLQLADELRNQLADAEAAKERLLRIRSALPTLNSWKAKGEELGELHEVVLLPEDAEKRRTKAHADLSLARSNLAQAREQLGRLEEQLQTLPLPSALLHEQERIDNLYRRLGSHEKDMEDRATLEARRRAARNNAKQTLERLGWALPLEEAAKQRPADDKKVVVRSLAKRHGEILQSLSAATKASAKSQRLLQDLKKQLAGAITGDVAKELTHALSEATALLEVSQGLVARRNALESLQTEANESLARLPLFSGSLAQLARLKAPVEEAVEAFEDRRRDIATRLNTLKSKNEEIAERESSLLEKLAALEKGGVVPTEDELLAARATRDRGVRLAVEALAGRTIDPQEAAAFVSETSEGANPASALQPSVRRADEVADRLRREADHVAEKSQLIAQQQLLKRQADQLATSVAQVHEDDRRYHEEWNGRWAATGLTPLSPPEMRGWLRQYTQLLELIADLSAQSDQLAADEQRCDAVRAALVQELSAAGVTNEAKSLREAIAIAREQIEALRESRAQRDRVVADIARYSQEVEEANEDLQAAEAALVAWRESWVEAVKFLRLPEDALPEQAEAALANLEQLFRELDEASGFGARVYGIDRTAEEFTQAARELAAVIAPDLTELPIEKLPVEELVATLNTRVVDARRIQQRVHLLTEQRESYESLQREAEAEAAQAQAALNGLLAEAGCASADDLAHAIQRSDQKRRLLHQVEELKTQLAPHCGGKSLEEFQSDAASEDPDRLTSSIAEIESRVARLREEREAALTAAERESGALQKYDGGDEAADKESQRQSLLAQAEEDVREYVVTTLAANLLRTAVERYQQRSQGPVLTLASERFGQLTCGAFSGLKTDYDEAGNDILVGVRPEGGALPVEGMSEGSRDQLYLALRLATLEHWFDHHEPVPFIVDDVLLTFDDARAEATLETLLKLSARTQVLIFTHHEHVLSLAKKVGDAHGGDAAMHIATAWNGAG